VECAPGSKALVIGSFTDLKTFDGSWTATNSSHGKFVKLQLLDVEDELSVAAIDKAEQNLEVFSMLSTDTKVAT
jgi:hypothetical protein